MMTYSEIALEMKISETRVRQLLKKALRRLRGNSEIKDLYETYQELENDSKRELYTINLKRN